MFNFFSVQACDCINWEALRFRWKELFEWLLASVKSMCGLKSLKNTIDFHNRHTWEASPRVYEIQMQFNFSSNKAKSFDILLDYSVDGAGVLCNYIILSLNMIVFLKKNKGNESFIFNHRL